MTREAVRCAFCGVAKRPEVARRQRRASTRVVSQHLVGPQRIAQGSARGAYFFFCVAPGARSFAPPGCVCFWPGAKSFAPPGVVCSWPGVFPVVPGAVPDLPFVCAAAGAAKNAAATASTARRFMRSVSLACDPATNWALPREQGQFLRIIPSIQQLRLRRRFRSSVSRTTRPLFPGRAGQKAPDRGCGDVYYPARRGRGWVLLKQPLQ